MAKFHINKHGVPAPCKAKPGNCPLGGDENHFNSMNEAQEHANKVNESSHGLLPGVTAKDKRNVSFNNWREKAPEEVEGFIETGIVKGFDDDFTNDNVFANGVSTSLENNFKDDLYPKQREYINSKTRDLVRMLRGDVRKDEESFINKDDYNKVNRKANEYYKDVMSEEKIIDEVLKNQYSPKELISRDNEDYEVHPIPITSEHKEMLGELSFLIVRKDNQAVLKNPIVDSQGLFINTYNNEPIDGSRYSDNYVHYNSATVSRLTTDMKQWRRDALNTEEYPDNQQIVDKYGPAMGRDSLPLAQIESRI